MYELIRISEPDGVEIIPLPGHFSDMVGFRTPDDVVGLADCLSSREPRCFETIFKKLLADYGLTMNFEQYVLVSSTVRSYLAWLKDNGRLNAIFEDNTLLWQQTQGDT